MSARLTLRTHHAEEYVDRTVVDSGKINPLRAQDKCRALGRYIFHGGVWNRDAIANSSTLEPLALQELSADHLPFTIVTREEPRKLREHLSCIQKLLRNCNSIS